MKEDLVWLGITWDNEIRQSDRLPHYRAAMERLLALGFAYPCQCSRRDLQQATQAPHDDADDEPIYNGRCRPASPQPTAALLPATNYRFRIPDACGAVHFMDLNAGPQSFTPGCNTSAGFGDFVVWRKDGLPSYQLACVVDDAAMGITEVVRGRDLLKSTARQILLQQALALPTPAYFHCDLMRDSAGVRLAKRHDALSLRSLRQNGLCPEQVRAQF